MNEIVDQIKCGQMNLINVIVDHRNHIHNLKIFIFIYHIMK